MTHSPDGLQWWDGQRWMPAVSEDGRLWFDGQRWVPRTVPPRRYRREPTEWTKSMQMAVIGVQIAGVVVGGIFAYFYFPAMSAALLTVSTSVPNGTGPATAKQMTDAVQATMNFAYGFGIVLAVVWEALVFVGTLRRWTWVYWVTMIFGLFGIVGFLQSMTYVVQGGIPLFLNGSEITIPIPRAVSAAAAFIDLVYFSLGIWMLIALVRRGPWATRKVPVTP